MKARDRQVEENKEEILEEEVTEETQETETVEETPEDKIKEWEDKFMRLYAEFDNFKKRTIKEKDARYADAVIDTVQAFLPVIDNLERAEAVEVEGDEAKKVKEGVSLVLKQVKETLQKLNISEIPAVGEEFNPNLHEAIMHVEDETIADNVVVEEFMKGYILKNDRVVRHSMVKVAN